MKKKLLLKTLDLNNFLVGGKARAQFLKDLHAEFSDTGFCLFSNHGISQDLLGQTKQVSNTFFNSPIGFRKKFEFKKEKHQRGYTPVKLEKGEFATIADEKHFLQFGPDRNVPIPEILGFNQVTDATFKAFERTALTLLEAIALSLELPADTFSKKYGNSILRAIDYPPNAHPLKDEGEETLGGNIAGMCASKHTDINVITLLDAKEKGLQLFHKGKWVEVTLTDPNLIVVNCGDMLQHITGGRYKSGLHRVVCRKNIRRFALPFFCHFNVWESVAPLKELGKSDRKKYPFRKVGNYLNHRLKQIGL